MADIKITSHDQKGGITAQNVNATPPHGRKTMRTAFAWIVGVATVLGAIAAIVAVWMTWRGQ